MAGSKWVGDLTGSTGLGDAARRVLEVRFKVVAELLPLARDDPYSDPEHVHQLRVGARRARAALDIFAICLPPKAYKKLKKNVRRVRRAAGEARDWDVFLAGLAAPLHEPGRRHRAGLDFLMGYALSRRALAQDHLRATTDDDPRSFEQKVADNLARVSDSAATELRTLADLARPRLSDLLADLDHAGDDGFDDYARLHQVRIIGKRLRYAMEVFASCFAPIFRDQLYPAVEEMQEILGDANDSHVAAERLEALRALLQVVLPEHWKRFKPGLEGLLRFHQKRLPQQRSLFLTWWEKWRQHWAPLFRPSSSRRKVKTRAMLDQRVLRNDVPAEFPAARSQPRRGFPRERQPFRGMP